MEFEKFIDENKFNITNSEAKNYNVLVFAFVGDAVFTLYVREFLASKTTNKAGILHTQTSNFVKASYQAKLIDILEKNLTEEEKRISNSARNSHTHNIAKNSNLEEYKKATSFESLLGYLYMTKQNERLNQILDLCKQQMEIDL